MYAQAADAEVFRYRENGRLEVDAVVQARDGRWAAFEVKLGPQAVEEGARNCSGSPSAWTRAWPGRPGRWA